MKNICFLLACLTFISVLPSQAMKIIVNNERDRIVYSRSSAPEQVIIEEETTAPVVKEKKSYYKSLKMNPEYYQYQLNLLGADFRTELAGTKWNYGQEEPISEVKEVATPQPQVQQDPRYKRASREAADYYMVDLMDAPNTLVPSGFPE